MAGFFDAIAHGRAPLADAFVAPQELPIGIGDADSLPYGVKNNARLLRGHGAFKREEIGGGGEDGIDGSATQSHEGLFHGMGKNDIVMGFKQVDKGGVAIIVGGEHEKFLSGSQH